jgi:peptide/nickel transport system ATP-binding protein
MKLINIIDLKKYFTVSKSLLSIGKQRYIKAVDGISFNIEKGETLGLIGESGSGKTTTGYCLFGIEKPTGGKIIFHGLDITYYRPKKIRGKIQMVFQDPSSSFNPRLRLIESIKEPLIALKGSTSNSAIHDVLFKVIKSVGLDEDLIYKYPHEISGGQLQRAAIARALVTDPEIIILDEPTSALDASIRSQILNLLLDIQKEKSLAYLLISHDILTAAYLSNVIAVMYAGKIVETGSAKDLLFKPKHPYTIALMTSIPLPDPRLRGRKKIILSGEPPSLLDPPKGCRFHPRCPYAMDICKKEEPQLIEIEPTHKVACWLYKSDTHETN